MMKFKRFALQTFAIIVSYLVMSISIVAAVPVDIFDTSGTNVGTANFDRNDLITYSVTPGVETTIEIWGSSGNIIDEILMYRCKLLEPLSCITSVEPDVIDEGYLQTTQNWADIGQQEGGTTFPQKANLLFLVKVHGIDFPVWTGLWISIQRTDLQEFQMY